HIAGLSGGEVLDLAGSGVELTLAGDDGDAEAAAIGVGELLAELFRLGKDFDADSRRPKLRRQPQIVVEAVFIEVSNDYGRGRANFGDQAQLFESGEQTIES